MTAGGGGFGHTWVYLELTTAAGCGQRGGCRTVKAELTAGGIGSSGRESQGDVTAGLGALSGTASGPSASMSGKGLVITIEDVDPKSKDMLKFKTAKAKRSFVVTKMGIGQAFQKAKLTQSTVKDYVYKVAGRGLTLKESINCARFGEKLLKAEGVSRSEASAGSIWKTPYHLATGGERKWMK